MNGTSCGESRSYKKENCKKNAHINPQKKLSIPYDDGVFAKTICV